MYPPVSPSGGDIVGFMGVIDDVQFAKSPENLAFYGFYIWLYLEAVIVRADVCNF